ncbi:MAG: tetratricopeptide repeat protein [Luteolibacter sp.]
MKFHVSIFLAAFLASCDEPAPIAKEPTEPTPETNPILAASQLALAKSHLVAEAYQKAIPYLQAAIENGATGEAENLLSETLANSSFSVPVSRFTPPYPVTTFVSSDTSLYVAIAGPHPTVVCWELGETPQVTDILFPSGAETIPHLVLSPSRKHLLVHRGDENLLCLAETLKPVTNLGSFPFDLEPAYLQPFSENSLLLAHPTADDHAVTWHIRDAATGETLRSEAFPLYPKPVLATFHGTTLFINLENRTGIEIPLLGDSRRITDFGAPAFLKPSPVSFTTDESSIIQHTTIPSPGVSASPSLLPSISGYRLNPTTQELTEIPTNERLAALSSAFLEIPPSFTIQTCESAVFTRLAAAFPEEFPEISAPAQANAEIVRSSFATGDEKIIDSLIASLPPSGLATSTALYLAYRSGNQQWIKAVITKTENLPPALLHFGDATTPIPDIDDLRRQQDWIGFEVPDFSPLFEILSEEKSETLEKLTLPADPSTEQITEFIAILQSNEALVRLGAAGIADSAIRAAHLLASDTSHAATAIALTTFAERYGASRSSALRIRAVSHTTLGDFASAHTTWLDLITNQPENQHLASDYAEAAYTAFETSAADQAIEILETGVFRFPDDVAFSIRASWLALLTNHPEQAGNYLKNATRIGLPADEIENSTALLAITHTQLGDHETALGYLEQLIAINPAWAEAETIEKLPWPEPLKASLRQLIWVP